MAREIRHQQADVAAERYVIASQTLCGGCQGMSFTTLSDDEERELHRLSHVYWKEALKCEKAKHFWPVVC